MGASGGGIDVDGALAAEVQSSVVTGCQNDAIRVGLSDHQLNGFGHPSVGRFVDNTVGLNGGVGLSLARASAVEGSEIPVTVNGNIFAANERGGVTSALPYSITLHRNDTWMNAGEAIAGLADADSNLTLDPQLCDPLAADYHVATSSPCAPTGPYGPMGELGVGCDAMTVGIDIKPGNPQNTIAARSNGLVAVAIMSNPVFDATQVDPLTIRLSGAPVVTKPPLQRRDVNGDGLMDLVANVDASAMSVSPGSGFAVLEGRTLYGAPIRGTARVRVVDSRGAGSATAEMDAEPATLAIREVQARGGAVVVAFELPRSVEASVDVFDLTGRRVEHRTAGGEGPHSATLQVPKAGIYWLRLSQTDEVRIRRIVVLD